MGSRSSSASSSAQTYTDDRDVSDASGGGVIGTGNRVTVTSGDAATAREQSRVARDIAGASLRTVGRTTGAAFDAVTRSQEQAFGAFGVALGTLADVAGRRESSGQGIALAALAVAGLVLVVRKG